MKTILIFCLLFLPVVTNARLILDVVIIHKRGIDKNMVLQSELHSSQEVVGNKQIELKKSGIKVELTAEFNKFSKNYGPPAEVLINGLLKNSKDVVLKEIEGEEGIIPLHEERMLIYKDDAGSLIEITIKPYTL